MKRFIQNTSLNRVLLALAVSVAAGGVANASPAGTVTPTITTPANSTYIDANSPTTFDGSIATTANGVNATGTYNAYFFGGGMTYPVDSNSFPVYVNNPNTQIVSTNGGPPLPVGYYYAYLDCTLSAPGKTNVPNTATTSFGAH